MSSLWDWLTPSDLYNAAALPDERAEIAHLEGAMGLRVIQPPTWAGMQKGGPGSPMVCGACANWHACDAENRCARATDEDYNQRFFPATYINHDSHSWFHRCFPPKPSTCILCGAESGSLLACEPCTLAS